MQNQRNFSLNERLQKEKEEEMLQFFIEKNNKKMNEKQSQEIQCLFCQKFLPKPQLTSHQNDCEERSIRCDYCGEQYPWSLMKMHIGVCTEKNNHLKLLRQQEQIEKNMIIEQKVQQQKQKLIEQEQQRIRQQEEQRKKFQQQKQNHQQQLQQQQLRQLQQQQMLEQFQGNHQRRNIPRPPRNEQQIQQQQQLQSQNRQTRSNSQNIFQQIGDIGNSLSEQIIAPLASNLNQFLRRAFNNSDENSTNHQQEVFDQLISGMRQLEAMDRQNENNQQNITQNQVEELVRFNFKNTRNLSPSARQCIICQEEFKENEQMTMLSCTHRYHDDCIDVWLKKSKLCPICKQNINS